MRESKGISYLYLFTPENTESTISSVYLPPLPYAILSFYSWLWVHPMRLALGVPAVVQHKKRCIFFFDFVPRDQNNQDYTAVMSPIASLKRPCRTSRIPPLFQIFGTFIPFQVYRLYCIFRVIPSCILISHNILWVVHDSLNIIFNIYCVEKWY